MNVYFKEPCYTIRHLNFQKGEDDKSCKLPVTRRPRKRTRRLTTRTDAWKWEVDCRPTQWISINKYKRQSGKWAKDESGNYHLEAGVTVVGPHLDSARQLAQSDHNVSHVAMCYNVSHVTCHRLGVSPSWNPSWGAHQEFVQNPRADVNFVFPWIQNQQWLEINVTVWFPPCIQGEMAFLSQI